MFEKKRKHEGATNIVMKNGIYNDKSIKSNSFTVLGMKFGAIKVAPPLLLPVALLFLLF